MPKLFLYKRFKTKRVFHPGYFWPPANARRLSNRPLSAMLPSTPSTAATMASNSISSATHFTRPTRHTDLRRRRRRACGKARRAPTGGVDRHAGEGRHFFPTPTRRPGLESLGGRQCVVIAARAPPRLALPGDCPARRRRRLALPRLPTALRCARGLWRGPGRWRHPPRSAQSSVTICGEVPPVIRRDGASMRVTIMAPANPRPPLALWHLRDQLPLDPAHRDACLTGAASPQPRAASVLPCAV